MAIGDLVMGDWAYRLLLILQSGAHRRRYGDEMAAVFADLREQVWRERGLVGLAVAWMKETRDIVRSAARQRLDGRVAALGPRRSQRPARGPGLLAEIRWAWRGVRSRGWRFALMVFLGAVALAANATMFAFTDALVFDAFPFPEPERIVTLEETLAERTFLTREQAARRMEAWADQTDLIESTGGYRQKTLFVTNTGITERVRTADVTIGFLDVLGVTPRWGRGFVAGDEDGMPEFAVLISEGLADRVFGGPRNALGQILETTAAPHRVVGVMDATFGYPSAAFEVWRAFDMTGPLARNMGPPEVIARLAPELSLEQAQARIEDRAGVVGASIGVDPYAVAVGPLVRSALPSSQRTMFIVLLGAALCLLLATFANVASLELASAINRSRTHAVQLALGAPRASLARVASLEGAILVALAAGFGVLIAQLTLGILVAELPDTMLYRTQARVDVGSRAIVYMLLVACAAWLLASLPPIIAATRSSLLSLLQIEDRATAASRGAVRLRRVLTVLQVAVAVALISTGLLYARSYRELLAIDKGFDSAGVAEIATSYPTDFFDARPGGRQEFARQVRETLTAVPGVAAVTQAATPPFTGNSPSPLALEIDDRPPLAEPVHVGANLVDTSYFDVVRLPLRDGRLFIDGDPPDAVVVPESFARRFWPAQSPVGHRFRERAGEPPKLVIGVVGDFRSDRLAMPSSTDRASFYYSLWSAIPTSVRQPPPRPADWVDPGGSTGFLNVLARLDDPATAPAVLAAARALDPALRVTLEFIDDVYARQNADTRLATTVVSAFSLLSFVIAVVGVYGVMTVLVTGRRREFGIRMALGAAAADVQRLVLTSSLRLVMAGAMLGAALAYAASQWIESQLYGVSPTDPATYVVVVATVTVAALVATWLPSRLASRVDPAVTLKSD